jgi:cellulose synthase/poly-beta-1,6-N-acetylglucosamine synthase-like glycosyltransferase
VIILFAVAAGILAHAYIGYPLSLLLLRALRGDRARHRTEDRLPAVSLVISAYNEDKVLRRKLENTLGIDYPRDRLETIVVSDGSTDGTEAIAREYAGRGVRLEAFQGRQGKVACLNLVLPGIRSEIIVLSDANSMYDRSSLRRLVRHFADERVGCVCGQLTYVNPRRLLAGEGERVYWGYERFIKRLESGLGSLLGANGAIYAFRAGLFRPVDPLMFCDDVIPIRIAIGGRLTLYDPEASCTEEAADEAVEVRRRRRHASFGLRSMLCLAREAARRGRPLVLYQIVSHRILRWLGGPALLTLLAATPGLPEPWRSGALVGQGLFYTLALAGLAVRRVGRGPAFLYYPYYFLVIAAAGVRGLVAWLRRSDLPHWEPRQ